MEWFSGVYYLVTGGALAVGLWESFRRQRVRLQAFRNTAELCGLQMVRISTPALSRMKLEAQAGPVTVRVEDIRDRKREYGIRIVIRFPGPPGFAGVRIRREMYRPSGAREVEVGDERFDSAFYVEGPTRLLSVLLTAETRLQLANVNAKGRLLIAGGEIQMETWDVHFANVLSLLLQLVRWFMEEVDVAQRLAENARQDPVAGVRLRNLLVLARGFPGEPVTLEALRASCSDPIPQIRLRAAMELGAEARALLLELAESTESSVDDAVSAQAVARLARELPFERTQAILAHALRKRRIQTARTCLELLGSSGETAAVDILAKVLAVERGELAIAAALGLGATGSAAAEAPLLPALQREREDIRLAAATALGLVGSREAVLPLREAAERSPRDQKIRLATRQAIAKIRSRLQGASPGQLSFPPEEPGPA